MALTYTAIATVTVGSGGAADIEFTSIPGTYTDLIVLTSVRSTGNETSMQIQFNSSTTNRSVRYLYGDGSSAGSGSDTNMFVASAVVPSTYTSNTFANGYLYIPNYAGSTAKSSMADASQENNSTTAYSALTANLWNNTSAITSIKFSNVVGTGVFAQYSTATLYGIKNTV